MGIFSLFNKKRESEIFENNSMQNIDYMESDAIKRRTKSTIYNFEIDNGKVLEDNNKSKLDVNLNKEELDERIKEEVIKVVEKHDDFNTLQKAAKSAADIIGVSNIEILKSYLYNKIAKPAKFKGRYNGVGQWSVVLENSILTILYSFEEKGVDELLKITVEKEKLTLKVINLLSKLAARGIEREKIIDSIIYIMKPMKEEEILSALEYLSQIKNDEKVDRLLKMYYRKYIVGSKLESAYDVALSIINFKNSTLQVEQLTFIKALALVEGKLSASIFLKDEEAIVNFSTTKEQLRIKAAISFYNLKKDDEEINNKLIYLKDNSLDKELRNYLKQVL